MIVESCRVAHGSIVSVLHCTHSCVVVVGVVVYAMCSSCSILECFCTAHPRHSLALSLSLPHTRLHTHARTSTAHTHDTPTDTTSSPRFVDDSPKPEKRHSAHSPVGCVCASPRRHTLFVYAAIAMSWAAVAVWRSRIAKLVDGSVARSRCVSSSVRACTNTSGLA